VNRAKWDSPLEHAAYVERDRQAAQVAAQVAAVAAAQVAEADAATCAQVVAQVAAQVAEADAAATAAEVIWQKEATNQREKQQQKLWSIWDGPITTSQNIDSELRLSLMPPNLTDADERAQHELHQKRRWGVQRWGRPDRGDESWQWGVDVRLPDWEPHVTVNYTHRFMKATHFWHDEYGNRFRFPNGSKWDWLEGGLNGGWGSMRDASYARQLRYLLRDEMKAGRVEEKDRRWQQEEISRLKVWRERAGKR